MPVNVFLFPGLNEIDLSAVNDDDTGGRRYRSSSSSSGGSSSGGDSCFGDSATVYSWYGELEEEEELSDVPTDVVGTGDEASDDDAMQAALAECAELYSPVRVNKYMKRYGMRPGSSMDLLTGWDFDRSSDRAAAVRRIDEEGPSLVIGSPMCTMFSALQNLQLRNDAGDKRLDNATKHIKFAVAVYRRQKRQGRYFLHEHPHGADSWQMEEVQELLKEDEVLRVRGICVRLV